NTLHGDYFRSKIAHFICFFKLAKRKLRIQKASVSNARFFVSVQIQDLSFFFNLAKMPRFDL
ncbi:MAG: hypothetical protein B5M51_03460, partial [Anaerolinea sp. 4484_236]